MVVNISSSPMFDRMAALAAESQEQEAENIRCHITKLREEEDAKRAKAEADAIEAAEFESMVKDWAADKNKSKVSAPAKKKERASGGDRRTTQFIKSIISALPEDVTLHIATTEVLKAIEEDIDGIQSVFVDSKEDAYVYKLAKNDKEEKELRRVNVSKAVAKHLRDRKKGHW